MGELLLELFSEEIPARMQGRAAEDLKRLVTERLARAGLTFDAAESYVTPRRLTLVVDGLPASQPDVTEEKKGPRVGAPEQAVQGFLKGASLASLDQCEQRDTGKGVFWFAVAQRKGQATAAVLPGLITEAVMALPWPKSMRWAGHEIRWVRPLHGIVAMLDGMVLDGHLPLGGGQAIRFGTATRGHRFLHPEAISVTGFVDYRTKLYEAKVMLDPADRRAAVRAQSDSLAAAEGLTIRPDEALLEEVTGLVEWPVVLMGQIDRGFMELPPEVLITSMRAHQKYFSLLDKVGGLAPRFLMVSNMETADRGRTIVSGNERVLRARLSDAKFFWDQDRKTKLEARVPTLKDVVFHARLGTVADKVRRVQALAAALAPSVPGADPDRLRRAALLAKADLTTGMVGEFPELQGVMGRYYALGEGEEPAIADAIAEHYAPLGPNDRCPTAPLSVAVALADKIDTLVGFFGIDEKPTGSKDPYALRRAALGVIRLIIENKLRLPLGPVFAEAGRLLTEQNSAIGDYFKPDELMEFFADRLKVALKEQGVRHDLISAVFALGGEDDLVRLLARVDALKAFLESDDGANLLTAYKRAGNIVRIEEKKDKTRYDGDVDRALLRAPEEQALAAGLAEAGEASRRSLATEDFAGAMAALSRLRRPIDIFFDEVTVNSDEVDLRANRLRLLSQIRATLGGVADFSRIEG
jgi:glycyl-tRNA synthetase beta chain